jgi:hypothetical protein
MNAAEIRNGIGVNSPLIASVASSMFTASCVHGVERRAPDQATRLSIEDLAWAVIDGP